VAEGKGLQEADVGSEATFVIRTRDSNGKQCYDEKDQAIVKAETPSEEELKHTITNENSGQYNVSFTPDCPGQHEVAIEINDQLLTGSLWRVHVTPHRYKRLFSFGAFGKAQEQFANPLSIAINDTTGNIAVADSGNNRVQLFSSEGEYLKAISTKELIEPTSVAFTRSSDLIVIASNKIFCFNDSDKFVKNINNKHLNKPLRLTIARDGRMVVCDLGDYTVKVLIPDGSPLLLTISDPDHKLPCYAVCQQDMSAVCYFWARTVKIFSKDGVLMHSIGTRGSGDGQLSIPAGLSFDRFSNLVVCDRGSNRLQIFTIDGKFVNTTVGQHTDLVISESVVVSTAGQLFVTDSGKHCVHVYQ